MKQQCISAHSALLINKEYTTKAIQARIGFSQGVNSNFATVLGRSDINGLTVNTGQNDYTLSAKPGASNQDFVMRKDVAGSASQIAAEAVDITPGLFYAVLLNCNGTTIAGYRGANSYNNDIQGSSSMSATDSSHTSGKFGLQAIDTYWVNSNGSHCYQTTLVQGAYLRGSL